MCCLISSPVVKHFNWAVLSAIEYRYVVEFFSHGFVAVGFGTDHTVKLIECEPFDIR